MSYQIRNYQCECDETYKLYQNLRSESVALTTGLYQAGIYLFKVSTGDNRTMREICLKLIIKTPERRQWRRCGVLIVNFEQTSDIVLISPLLILNKEMLAGLLMAFTHWPGISSNPC